MNSDEQRREAVAEACRGLDLSFSRDHRDGIADILRSLEAAQDIVASWLEKAGA